MIIRIVILVAALGTICFAQAPIEGRFAVGSTTFVDDGGDTHFDLAPSVRYYFRPKMAVEVEFQYLRQGSDHYDVVLLPSFVWDTRRGRVVPYLSVGAGLIYSSFRFVLPSSQTFQYTTGSNPFFQGVAGVKFFLNERLYVAPEFKIGVEAHATVRGVLGYRWGR